MLLSIIIPAYNEVESLPELTEWIQKVCDTHNIEFEVIFIDDGSTDQSWELIQEIQKKKPNFKGIRFLRNYGKSAALNEGFKYAHGDYVMTMDADMQDSPDEIPELLSMIQSQKLDIVSGWKKKRYDNTLTKNLPSKLFNATARNFSGIKLHDFNCGLKIYRKKVIKSIEVFGEMHRYIPFIAKRSGFSKISEKVVVHRPRKYGHTKYGWDRFIYGFVDLITILFLSKFGKKPMQFFGSLGVLFFMSGFIGTAILVYEKLTIGNFALAGRPIFYIALITMIMGVQFFLSGFVAELITRNAADRNVYLIEDSLGLEIEHK